MRIFIDAREPKEYASGHVAGAINIPPSDVLAGAKQLVDVDKSTEIIIYCLSGARSNSLINILHAKGFTNLVNGINKEQVAKRYNLSLV